MIRDTLAALGEAAFMIAALVGICLLIIAPFVLTLHGGLWILTGLLTWPVALWAVFQMDGREGR